jgi:hypothetical protein
MYYHVTSASNIESIRQNGLIPQIGARSLELGETISRIYLFTSKKFCEDGLMNWLGDYFEDEEIVILEIESVHVQGVSEVEYEIACEHAISFKNIKIFNEQFLAVA